VDFSTCLRHYFAFGCTETGARARKWKKWGGAEKSEKCNLNRVKHMQSLATYASFCTKPFYLIICL